MVDTYDPHTDVSTTVETTEKEPQKFSWNPSTEKMVEETVEEFAPEEIVIEVASAPKKAKPKKKVGKPAKVKKPAKRAKAKKESIPLDDFGFRKGTIRSKAAAMYGSTKGATLAEVKNKLGSVQYNMLISLEQNGYKITRKEIDGIGNRPATRFFLHAKKR